MLQHSGCICVQIIKQAVTKLFVAWAQILKFRSFQMVKTIFLHNFLNNKLNMKTVVLVDMRSVNRLSKMF